MSHETPREAGRFGDDYCEPCVTAMWCAATGKCLAEASPPAVPTGLIEELEKMAVVWIGQAEDARLNRGQYTREKRGYEVLEACGWAIQDLLAALRTRG